MTVLSEASPQILQHGFPGKRPELHVENGGCADQYQHTNDNVDDLAAPKAKTNAAPFPLVCEALVAADEDIKDLSPLAG